MLHNQFVFLFVFEIRNTANAVIYTALPNVQVWKHLSYHCICPPVPSTFSWRCELVDMSFCPFQRKQMIFSWNLFFSPISPPSFFPTLYFPTRGLFLFNFFWRCHCEVSCHKSLSHINTFSELVFIILTLRLVRLQRKKAWEAWPPAAALSCFSQIPRLTQSTGGINRHAITSQTVCPTQAGG